ncbi:MAG TPA: hypothetical protein VF278_07045 [Pirellulales bacterium]
MATSAPNPEPTEEASYGGTIVLCGIIALGLTWTYLLFGASGLGWWVKGGATIVIFPTMYFGWRWRQQKINRQLEVLQRWADDDDAKTKKRRKPA